MAINNRDYDKVEQSNILEKSFEDAIRNNLRMKIEDIIKPELDRLLDDAVDYTMERIKISSEQYKQPPTASDYFTQTVHFILTKK